MNKTWFGAGLAHNLAEIEGGVLDAERTHLGEGTMVWRFAHVGLGAVIGSNCMIGEGVHVGPGVKVGNGCKIQNGAQLFEGVTLEDDVFIGPHVVFTNVLTPRAFVDRRAEFKPTLVKKGASIGANATIICGKTIDAYAIVGAGTVVTRDVLRQMIVVGNPAADAGFACECGERLFLYAAPPVLPYATCPRCTARYTFNDAGPVREPPK